MKETQLAAFSFVAWSVGAAFAGRLGIWISIGGAAVAIAAVLLLLDGAPLLALLRPRPKQLLLGLFVGVAMAAATWLLYPIAVAVVPSIGTETAWLYAAFSRLSPMMSALVLAPIIFSEDLIWRGLVQTALAKRLGPVAAVIVGALLYALAHAPVGSPILVVTALACGLVWGGLRAWTGNLTATLLSHLVWDALVMVAFPVATAAR